MLSPDAAAEIKKIVQEAVKDFVVAKPPSPQASPYPPQYQYPAPADPIAQLKTLIELQSLLKKDQTGFDLTAEIDKHRKLQELIGSGMDVQESPLEDTLIKAFAPMIAQKIAAKQQGIQITTLPSDKVPDPLMTPLTELQEQYGSDDLEETYSDAELKELVKMVPEKYAKDVLAGKIPKFGAMVILKSQGFIISDQEFDRALVFLRELHSVPINSPVVTEKKINNSKKGKNVDFAEKNHGPAERDTG